MATVSLGRVQLQIMQVLWDRGQASAREITESINAITPITHSTVQTMLRVLEDKHAVTHRLDGRTFIFYPLVPESDFKQSATQNLLESVFGGSVKDLVSHLLNCRNTSKQEIDELRQLINQQRKR
jgi:predicted transcriptional regulator